MMQANAPILSWIQLHTHQVSASTVDPPYTVTTALSSKTLCTVHHFMSSSSGVFSESSLRAYLPSSLYPATCHTPSGQSQACWKAL